MATARYDEEDLPRRRRWPWLLLLALLLFAAGAAAAGYAIARLPRLAGALGLVSHDEARADILATRINTLRSIPRPPPAPTPVVAAPDPETTGAIAELREKVGDIETQARAATGDASRAEGLLVAFAARRALDRGFELGYIESLLRQRFGRSQPAAVATILSASRTPVTLADLQNGLDAIAPQLAGGDEQGGWWQAFRREIAGMVTIRRADVPSTVPADRVARAQRMLEGGQVDGALAEVLRLPARDAAQRWIVMARRYLAGRGALDRIETAALLDPGDAPVATGNGTVTPSDNAD
ncbi:hypothetical protein [Sphingomonas sp.]|uniref:hypothetical protein n=1 Tax=Sphingomonas sp. TaxID=28214 RepID=UPI003B007F36